MFPMREVGHRQSKLGPALPGASRLTRDPPTQMRPSDFSLGPRLPGILSVLPRSRRASSRSENGPVHLSMAVAAPYSSSYLGVIQQADGRMPASAVRHGVSVDTNPLPSSERHSRHRASQSLEASPRGRLCHFSKDASSRKPSGHSIPR